MPAITATVTNSAGGATIASLISANANYLNYTGQAVNWLTVRGDDLNAGTFIYVGDAAITSTNYGARLAPGDSRTWTTPGGTGTNCVGTLNKWLLASAGATNKVNISWEVA